MWYPINMNSNLQNGISELARASRHRFADARALLRAARWQGAMYIAGYAVECLLKTKLMHVYGCRTLGDLEDELQRRSILPKHSTVFTHQLEVLLRLAPGWNRLMQNSEMRRLSSVHRRASGLTENLFILAILAILAILLLFSNKVNKWTPTWRYTSMQATREEATEFIDSVDTVMRWVDNNI